MLPGCCAAGRTGRTGDRRHVPGCLGQRVSVELLPLSSTDIELCGGLALCGGGPGLSAAVPPAMPPASLHDAVRAAVLLPARDLLRAEDLLRAGNDISHELLLRACLHLSL